jgi:hypothetical protein
VPIGATPGLRDPQVEFQPYKEQIDKCFEVLDAEDRRKLIALSQQIALGAHARAQASGSTVGFHELYETLMSTKIFRLEPKDIGTLDLLHLLEQTFGCINDNLKGQDRIWLYLDWSVVKNPRLLAAVFYLSTQKPGPDHWITTQSIRENIACMAFEGGERLAELEVELKLIEEAKRGVRLVKQLPKMGLEFHHYRIDDRKLAMIERHGGVPGMLEKGVDGLQFCNSLVSDLDHANPGRFLRMHEVLGEVIARLRFEDKISEEQGHTLKNRTLSKLLTLLGKQPARGRHAKGWSAMVAALMPYAGSKLDLEDYMVLGTVSGQPEVFRDLKLDTVLNRPAFRKRHRSSSPFKPHDDIIQILGVESFYSQAEVHRLNPFRGVLWRLVLALEEAAAQSSVVPAYAEDLKGARELLASTESLVSIIVRLNNYTKALSPYAPATLGEASFIYLSHVNRDQPTAWPPGLCEQFDRAEFRKTLRAIMAVEHHLPIIKDLGVESFFGPREINRMKGAHLSDALGL